MSFRPAINSNQDTQGSSHAGFGGSISLRESNSLLQFWVFRRIKEQSKHIPRLLKSKRSQSSDRRNGAFNLPHEEGLPQSHLRYCIITSLLACCTTLDASRGVWGPGRWGRLNTARRAHVQVRSFLRPLKDKAQTFMFMLRNCLNS